MRMCDSRLESTAVGKWRQQELQTAGYITCTVQSREKRMHGCSPTCSVLLFLLLHHSDFPVQGMALPAVAVKQFPTDMLRGQSSASFTETLPGWHWTHAEGLCSCSLTCPNFYTTVTMDFKGTQTCIHHGENCSSWCNQAFQSLVLLWFFLTVIDSFFSLPSFWKVT